MRLQSVLDVKKLPQLLQGSTTCKMESVYHVIRQGKSMLYHDATFHEAKNISVDKNTSEERSNPRGQKHVSGQQYTRKTHQMKTYHACVPLRKGKKTYTKERQTIHVYQKENQSMQTKTQTPKQNKPQKKRNVKPNHLPYIRGRLNADLLSDPQPQRPPQYNDNRAHQHLFRNLDMAPPLRCPKSH